MRFSALNKFVLGGVIIAIALLLIGGIVFSGKAYGQSAGVSTMSAGATQCGTGGGGECDECDNNE